MAVHREDGHGELDAVPGNFVSAMGAALPVHVDDPGDRLRSVHASTQAAKIVQAALGDDLLSDLVDVPPPALISALVGAYTGLHLDALHPPIFNAIVSNVPGPPLPVYSCGARLLAVYPLGPLLVRSGLNISVLSYVDSMDVGVTTCPDIVDDPWRIAEGMPAGSTSCARQLSACLTTAVLRGDSSARVEQGRRHAQHEPRDLLGTPTPGTPAP